MRIRFAGSTIHWLAILSLTVCTQARAGVVAVSNQVGPTNSAADNSTWGWDFSTSASIFVDALGHFDAGGNGLADRHRVSIWNTATQLRVADAFVGSGTSGTLLQGFRWVSIPDVLLGPGTYRVTSHIPTGADVNIRELTSYTVAPGIVYDGGHVWLEFGDVYPTQEQHQHAPGYFGGNFQFRLVPEPGGIALCGFGLAGLAIARWRRK